MSGINVLTDRSAAIVVQRIATLRRSGVLPFHVFDSNMSLRGWMAFDDLLWKRGFLVMQKLIDSSGRGAYWAVTDPDPVDYYFASYGVTAVAEVCAGADVESYCSMVERLTSNPADAPRFRADSVCVVDMGEKWVIWGDRACNMACVLSVDANAGQLLDLGLASTESALRRYASCQFSSCGGFFAFARLVLGDFGR